jgi:hypothetical protein
MAKEAHESLKFQVPGSEFKVQGLGFALGFGLYAYRLQLFSMVFNFHIFPFAHFHIILPHAPRKIRNVPQPARQSVPAFK